MTGDPKSSHRARLREAIRSGALKVANAKGAPPPSTGAGVIGSERREFRVRKDLDDTRLVHLVDAVLWAVGDSVAIWVDDDVAIDWDIDCDGTIDQEDAAGNPSNPRPAYGFDNCDLSTIADIVDTNIVPNLRSIYGDESDVDTNGLVHVVVTPVLNAMSLTSEDEEDYAHLIGSYADPEVDLTEWSPDINPLSDEGEVIYVSAPDPHGFFNPYAPVSLEEYTSVELAAEVARSFSRLISYNQHVLIAEGDQEKMWLLEGLASLGADLTGFGASNFEEVWTYLDAPHLSPLMVKEADSVINTQLWGAQYLFVRWVLDVHGEAAITALVQSGAYGGDNIESATDSTMVKLVGAWQRSLFASGLTRADGSDIVDPLSYKPYAEVVTIAAPIASPIDGELYGANGYQMGVSLHGVNRYMEQGTTSAPVENADKRVLLGGQDHNTMVTGVDFFTHVVAGYGTAVVRLSDIPFDAAAIEIQSSITTGRFVGTIVRLDDLTEPDLEVEDVFSATDANYLALPTLPADGSEVYGVGSISDPGSTLLVGATGGVVATDVYDTDRWLLDLGHLTGTVEIAVAMDRHYENLEGDIGLFDPWLAVVEEGLVPTPTVGGTTRGTCAEVAAEFAYPASVLEYLYAQLFLSPDVWEAGSVESGTGGDTGAVTLDFDPCGEQSVEPTTCADDWDGDGVADISEPMPTTFVEQVQVMQCSQNGGTYAGLDLVDSSIVDLDSVDLDSVATANMEINMGGRNHGSGEEAYHELELVGGQRYIIVVGGGTDTGAYELSVRQVN